MRMSDELFETGLAIRKEVLGADYVERSMAQASDFMAPFQRMTTEWCWGAAWGRPGLDRKTRSLLNLAILTALGKPAELRLHVTVYCGIPAGLEAFRAANAMLEEEGALKS